MISKLPQSKIQVEEIQDLIEHQLVQEQKYELAKKYIIYRYKHALVRKANTTDESILSLIHTACVYAKRLYRRGGVQGFNETGAFAGKDRKGA